MDGERTETVNGSGIPVRNERRLQWLVAGICIIAFLGGFSAGTFFSRLYFQRGGHIRSLQWLLLCIGSPIPLLPILLDPQNKVSFVTATYLIACGLLGVMAARISLLYYSGISLLCETSLAFSILLAFLLLQHRIPPCALNSIIFLLFNAAVLGIWSTGKRPGVSRGHFNFGFVFTILACAIDGLLFAVAYIAFQEVAGEEHFAIFFITKSFALMVAAMVGMVGLFINGDFGHLLSEYRDFMTEIGGYWFALISSAVAWQTFFLAIIALVFLASSLFSSVIITLALSLVTILLVFLP